MPDRSASFESSSRNLTTYARPWLWPGMAFFGAIATLSTRPVTGWSGNAAGNTLACWPTATRAMSASSTFTSAMIEPTSAIVISDDPAMPVALATAVSPILMGTAVTVPSMGARTSVLARCSRDCDSSALACSSVSRLARSSTFARST